MASSTSPVPADCPPDPKAPRFQGPAGACRAGARDPRHARADHGADHAAAQAIAEAVNTEVGARAPRGGARPADRLPALSTGYPALDAATGLGGLPRGHITEIVGRPTAGRETIATRAVAGAGGYTAWVDVRGLVDVDALARAGVNLDRLFILRPSAPLDALAMAGQVIASAQFDVVVLDALADLPSGGATARALEQFARVVTPALGRSATVCIVLASPEQGEHGLPRAAALRIGLVQVSLIHAGGVFRGWRTRATVLKARGREPADCGIEMWL